MMKSTVNHVKMAGIMSKWHYDLDLDLNYTWERNFEQRQRQLVPHLSSLMLNVDSNYLYMYVCLIVIRTTKRWTCKIAIGD